MRLIGMLDSPYVRRVAVSLKFPVAGPAQPMDAVGIAVACAWRFSQHSAAADVPVARCPKLAAYSQRAEALPEFASTPPD